MSDPPQEPCAYEGVMAYFLRSGGNGQNGSETIRRSPLEEACLQHIYAGDVDGEEMEGTLLLLV